MEKKQDLSLIKHFEPIDDPRKERKKLHKLIDIIFISICAVIANADSFVDIQRFGEAKKNWFKKYLELPNGIPSHDTFGRVFALLDPEKLKEYFLSWVKEIMNSIDGEVIAIDGKTIRHSFDKVKEKNAIHIVSAWATENMIVLGQKKVNEKSNEITAIPDLLEILDIKNCIITIDAMGTQKDIAKKIVKKEADYVLALKGNQGTLCEDVKLFLDGIDNKNEMEIDYDYFKTIDKDHGRIEIRECFATADLDWLSQKDQWEKITTIFMIKSKRIIEGKTTTETRYYISSLAASAEKNLNAVRKHWGVENSLHWSLDVSFREDESRIRKDNAPENFNLIRHMALNLLKQDKSLKVGITAKRKNAGWDEKYLMQILKSF
jgi:predicted transposase YbfD/YdcC